MKLREAISRLNTLDDDATLFVERLQGEFSPESEVVVYALSDEELLRPVGEVALNVAPGKEYFLEVSVAVEVVDDCKSLSRRPGDEDIVRAVIYYAENDAPPQWLFDA